MEQEYWPGSGIPKSTNNAFTLGWSNKPHGFTAEGAAPAKLPVKKRNGGFGKNNGTIQGLSDKGYSWRFGKDK